MEIIFRQTNYTTRRETHKTRQQPTTIRNKLIILDIQNVKYFHLISFSVKEKKVKTVLFYTLMIFLHSNPFNRVEYEQFIETYRKYCSSKKLLAFRSNCETEPATYIFDIFKAAQFNTCEFDEIEIRKWKVSLWTFGMTKATTADETNEACLVCVFLIEPSFWISQQGLMASYLLLLKKKVWVRLQREQIKQFGKTNLGLLNYFLVKKVSPIIEITKNET